jgi:hypothetical protein
MTHVYVPEVGKRVKFTDLYHYAERHLPGWAWLLVEQADADVCTLRVLDGNKPTDLVTCVPTWLIEPPLCWEPEYTMTAGSVKEAEQLREWFHARGGIAIWASQALECAGRMLFTPGDRTDKPHWSMELVEVVTDLARLKCEVVEVRVRSALGKNPSKDGWHWDKSRREWYRCHEFSMEAAT